MKTETTNDTGPIVRLLKIAPGAFGIVVQRLAAGETLKEIADVWEIPYVPFKEWMIQGGRQLVHTTWRPTPPLPKRAASDPGPGEL